MYKCIKFSVTGRFSVRGRICSLCHIKIIMEVPISKHNEVLHFLMLNTVDGKAEFSASLLQSSVSHDPSET